MQRPGFSFSYVTGDGRDGRSMQGVPGLPPMHLMFPGVMPLAGGGPFGGMGGFHGLLQALGGGGGEVPEDILHQIFMQVSPGAGRTQDTGQSVVAEFLVARCAPSSTWLACTHGA